METQNTQNNKSIIPPNQGKSLAAKEEILPALPSTSWGAEQADASDIIIPRVLLMQGLSDFVKQRKAMAGDIVDSLSKKILGSFEKPIEIIPIMRAAKVWIVDEQLSPKTWTFKDRIEWSVGNAGWEARDQREILINGVLTRRTLCLDYFVVIPSMMDGLPHMISFRKTSFQTGKQMSTYFTECRMKNRPPASRVFTLGAHEKSKDSNSWFVFDLSEKRETNPEEMKNAYTWYQTLSTMKVKIDESEDRGEPDGDVVPF